MKKLQLWLFGVFVCICGCTQSGGPIAAIQSRWEKLKEFWGSEDLASKDSYASFEDAFIPLEEDLQMNLAEPAIPQPKEIPGSGRIPSLSLFKKAMGDLAQIFQNVYFNTDDHVLRKSEYVHTIERIAAYMKRHPHVYLSVGGHCDERESEAYNLALGTRRANYVRSLLVARGIDPNKIHSVSYGKEQPVDLGHNPTAWAKNRRAEFHIWEK